MLQGLKLSSNKQFNLSFHSKLLAKLNENENKLRFSMSEFFVYYGKSNTKYPATKCTCVFCGKTFLKANRWLQSRPLHVCSRECGVAYKAKLRSDSWVAEQHKCQHCGKLMTEKFGTGQFCSRACANTRKHSDETRRKISVASTAFYDISKLTESSPELTCLPLRQHYQSVTSYEKSPNFCIICNTVLPYEKRHNKTCSKACKNKLASINAVKNQNGGLTYGGGPKSTKHGKYCGFNCDSIYELVYLIYCLDHNIKIERNKQYFTYEFEGKIRKYYPDFYLPETDTLIELKGYKDSKVDLKLQAVLNSGKEIKILYKQDLLPYFEYVGKTYNKKYHTDYNNIEELYDESW